MKVVNPLELLEDADRLDRLAEEPFPAPGPTTLVGEGRNIYAMEARQHVAKQMRLSQRANALRIRASVNASLLGAGLAELDEGSA